MTEIIVPKPRIEIPEFSVELCGSSVGLPVSFSGSLVTFEDVHDANQRKINFVGGFMGYHPAYLKDVVTLFCSAYFNPRILSSRSAGNNRREVAYNEMDEIVWVDEETLVKWSDIKDSFPVVGAGRFGIYRGKLTIGDSNSTLKGEEFKDVPKYDVNVVRPAVERWRRNNPEITEVVFE